MAKQDPDNKSKYADPVWQHLLARVDPGHDRMTPDLASLPRLLTYAAVVDVHNVESEITEQMVSQACEKMESEQQFPFAPRHASTQR